MAAAGFPFRPNKWLVCYQGASATPAVSLVCLPWAGGQPMGYKAWVGKLHARLNLWAVYLPGRGKR